MRTEDRERSAGEITETGCVESFVFGWTNRPTLRRIAFSSRCANEAIVTSGDDALLSELWSALPSTDSALFFSGAVYSAMVIGVVVSDGDSVGGQLSSIIGELVSWTRALLTILLCWVGGKKGWNHNGMFPNES